jgi:hypothetical protein
MMIGIGTPSSHKSIGIESSHWLYRASNSQTWPWFLEIAARRQVWEQPQELEQMGIDVSL